eukprot:gene13465-biopygen1993
MHPQDLAAAGRPAQQPRDVHLQRRVHPAAREGPAGGVEDLVHADAQPRAPEHDLPVVEDRSEAGPLRVGPGVARPDQLRLQTQGEAHCGPGVGERPGSLRPGRRPRGLRRVPGITGSAVSPALASRCSAGQAGRGPAPLWDNPKGVLSHAWPAMSSGWPAPARHEQRLASAGPP